jgi:hypothetical protein
LEEEGQIDHFIIDPGGIRGKVCGAIVWEVAGLWVPVFGLSEVIEEVLDKGGPGVFRYGRLNRIIDGAFAVLDLCVP